MPSKLKTLNGAKSTVVPVAMIPWEEPVFQLAIKVWIIVVFLFINAKNTYGKWIISVRSIRTFEYFSY